MDFSARDAQFSRIVPAAGFVAAFYVLARALTQQFELRNIAMHDGDALMDES